MHEHGLVVVSVGEVGRVAAAAVDRKAAVAVEALALEQEVSAVKLLASQLRAIYYYDIFLGSYKGSSFAT